MTKIKIKTEQEITEIADRLRNNNKIIVTTNGAFDILHRGHVYTLERAKRIGDVLIVCVNTDLSIQQYKSVDRPFNKLEDRTYLLSALECVDYVVSFMEPDPRLILSKIKPLYHVKSKEGYKGLEEEVIRRNAGQIILLDDLEGYSTTELIGRIENGKTSAYKSR